MIPVPYSIFNFMNFDWIRDTKRKKRLSSIASEQIVVFVIITITYNPLLNWCRYIKKNLFEIGLSVCELAVLILPFRGDETVVGRPRNTYCLFHCRLHGDPLETHKNISFETFEWTTVQPNRHKQEMFMWRCRDRMRAYTVCVCDNKTEIYENLNPTKIMSIT